MYAPITSSSFEVAMLQMKVADKLSGCLPELLALVQWEDALNMEMMLPGKEAEDRQLYNMLKTFVSSHGSGGR